MTRTETVKPVVRYVLAIVILLFITLIEIVLLSPSSEVAIILYFLLLASLLILAASDQSLSPYLLSMASVPTMRLINFGLPFTHGSMYFQYLAIAICMSTYIILIMRSPEFEHFRLWRKPKNWLIQIVVILSGSVIGYAAYLIVPPSVSIQNQPVGALIFSSVILIGSLGFVEEIVFRGILLDGATQQLDEFSSVIYVSILYAVLSMQAGQLLLVGFVFIVSIYYALVVRRANSLYGVIGAHSIAAVVYYVLGPYFLS